ncbi:MAG: bifunctional folylpolyglutamate synthase/dihydrofolate synthase [Halothece sp.]
MKIDQILASFQYFGVNLGLTRIQKLLTKLGNPEKQVPTIHVAGTNGKGSVCAYLSSVLTEAGYSVGRYTSPHLISWTERICLNEKPITETNFLTVLETVKEIITEDGAETPTLFEVVTAAAWLYFAQNQVDVAVMEVGLGGRLDATNVKDEVIASAITPVSFEHWQALGDTLGKIATEKAGILKANCPAFIAPQEPEAASVIQQRANFLNCPTTWVKPATASNTISQNYDPIPPRVPPFQRGVRGISCNSGFQNGDKKLNWAVYNDFEYPLPLFGEVQLTNSALAIATLQYLQKQGWNISSQAIKEGMRKTRWLGRLQWVNWQGRSLLIDGAHNTAAAKGLRQYVETLRQPVTWIMGILSTKEQKKILEILLRPEDTLYTVPVPDHSTTPPEELCAMQDRTKACFPYNSLEVALEKVSSLHPQPPTVILCGSLYLVGYFLSSYPISNQ